MAVTQSHGIVDHEGPSNQGRAVMPAGSQSQTHAPASAAASTSSNTSSSAIFTPPPPPPASASAASILPQKRKADHQTSNLTAATRLRSLSNHILTMPEQSTSALPPPPPPGVFTAAVVAQAPEDPLFGLMAAFRADPSDSKVDLGIGAYRDDGAKPWVLPVVRKTEDLLRSDPSTNHEYLPIAGLPEFRTAAQKLIFGADSPAIAEKRVSTVQAISGTGALHLGGLFLSKFHPSSPRPTVYVSNPTWANHHQIFANVGLRVQTYPYFDPATRGLDLQGMLAAVRAAPPGSVFVLHACAHNPTGVDPTREQWAELAAALRAGAHFPFFDCAYQGFASGDLAADAWAIRHFAAAGFEMAVAQSFAKNFGLYGERAGAFHFVTAAATPAPAEAAAHVASQLTLLQRSEISNPPAYGAKIASRVLNDPALFAEWEADLRTMSGRIKEMRLALRAKLEEKGTPGAWDHITNQIGMFSFTGLSEQQVLLLRQKWHVYMTKNGRISMAGLNTHNIDYFAEAVDSVVRETQQSRL